MLLLALDTAGPDCSVALARSAAGEPKILHRSVESIGRGHAERLMPMIEAALAAAGITFKNLDRIAVTVGPGSFTGLRVGIAVARGLALALDIPAVGVGSLPALLRPRLRHQAKGTMVAALDARRGEIFALAQEIGSREALFPALAAPATIIAQKLAGTSRPLVLTGNGAALLAAELKQRDVQIAGTAASPDISDVAVLGFRGEHVNPAPFYLRGVDAKPQLDRAVARA